MPAKEYVITAGKTAEQLLPKELKRFAHDQNNPILYNAITCYENGIYTWEQAMQIAAVEQSKLLHGLINKPTAMPTITIVKEPTSITEEQVLKIAHEIGLSGSPMQLCQIANLFNKVVNNKL